jgi:hypothetical protein
VELHQLDGRGPGPHERRGEPPRTARVAREARSVILCDSSTPVSRVKVGPRGSAKVIGNRAPLPWVGAAQPDDAGVCSITRGRHTPAQIMRKLHEADRLGDAGRADSFVWRGERTSDHGHLARRGRIPWPDSTENGRAGQARLWSRTDGSIFGCATRTRPTMTHCPHASSVVRGRLDNLFNGPTRPSSS